MIGRNFSLCAALKRVTSLLLKSRRGYQKNSALRVAGTIIVGGFIAGLIQTAEAQDRSTFAEAVRTALTDQREVGGVTFTRSAVVRACAISLEERVASTARRSVVFSRRTEFSASEIDQIDLIGDATLFSMRRGKYVRSVAEGEGAYDESSAAFAIQPLNGGGEALFSALNALFLDCAEASPSVSESDAADWRKAEANGTAAAYSWYLLGHPDGAFADVAENRILAAEDRFFAAEEMADLLDDEASLQVAKVAEADRIAEAEAVEARAAREAEEARIAAERAAADEAERRRLEAEAVAAAEAARAERERIEAEQAELQRLEEAAREAAEAARRAAEAEEAERLRRETAEAETPPAKPDPAEEQDRLQREADEAAAAAAAAAAAEEARRTAEAEEARRIAEVEAARRAAEVEAERQAAEAEKARLAAEAEKERRAAIERERQAAIEEAARRLVEEREAAAERELKAEEARRTATATEADEDALSLSRFERMQIQADLTNLGFNTRGVDGVFGAGTRGAIENWQRQADGVNVTGRLNRAQVGMLRLEANNAGFAALRDEPARSSPNSGGGSGNAEDEFWRNARASDSVTDYWRYMKRVEKGVFSGKYIRQARAEHRRLRDGHLAYEDRLGASKRREIKRKFASLGYPVNAGNSRFRTKTFRAAVRKFRRSKGLIVHNYVDATLIDYLNRS